jgi:mono/diheme cytochrome c family protein
MPPMWKGALAATLLIAIVTATGIVLFVKGSGLSARTPPGALETAVARRLRALAVPGEFATRSNPVPRTLDAIRSGMAHYADHCASCHANDGSGATEMGQAMYPPAPDMRQSSTQELSDGALFYIIEHGIRFTGMPAWGTGTPEGEESSWQLVHFIRHLPGITPEQLEEMAAMNPRPPAEIRLEIEEERFLRGEDPAPAPAQPHAH